MHGKAQAGMTMRPSETNFYMLQLLAIAINDPRSVLPNDHSRAIAAFNAGHVRVLDVNL